MLLGSCAIFSRRPRTPPVIPRTLRVPPPTLALTPWPREARYSEAEGGHTRNGAASSPACSRGSRWLPRPEVRPRRPGIFFRSPQREWGGGDTPVSSAVTTMINRRGRSRGGGCLWWSRRRVCTLRSSYFSFSVRAKNVHRRNTNTTEDRPGARTHYKTTQLYRFLISYMV